MTTWGGRTAFGQIGYFDNGLPDAGARPVIQFMRWCAVCETKEQFTVLADLANGQLGCCQGCGDERVIPYQRTNAEAA